MPSSAQVQDYLNTFIKLKSLLRTAEGSADPVQYENFINREILPSIFGAETKVTLAELVNFRNISESPTLAQFVGRNFKTNHDSEEYKANSKIYDNLGRFHDKLIKTTGDGSTLEGSKIVVPIRFASTDGEDHSLAMPKEYSSSAESSSHVVSRVGILGVKVRSSLHGLYQEDHVDEEFEHLVPKETLSVRLTEFIPLNTLTPVNAGERVEVVADLQGGFASGDVEISDPTEYFNTLPIESDGLKSNKLQGLVSIFNSSNPRSIGAGAYFTNSGAFGESAILYSGHDRQTHCHELMHDFYFGHIHANKRILPELIELNKRFDNPYATSILNYESVVGGGYHRDDEQLANIGLLDQILISANKFFSFDAIRSGVIPDAYKDLEGIEKFVELDPDKMLPATNGAAKIGADSLQRVLCVEAPIIIIEELAKKLFPGCASGDKLRLMSTVIRIALAGLSYGFAPAGLMAIVAGGAAVAGSKWGQKAIGSVAACYGIEDSIGSLLMRASELYQTLPKPARNFINQFLVSYVTNSLGESITEDAIEIGSEMFLYARSAAESQITALLTSSLSAVFRVAIASCLGSDDGRDAESHRVVPSNVRVVPLSIVPESPGAGAGVGSYRVPMQSASEARVVAGAGAGAETTTRPVARDVTGLVVRAGDGAGPVELENLDEMPSDSPRPASAVAPRTSGEAKGDDRRDDDSDVEKQFDRAWHNALMGSYSGSRNSGAAK